MGENYTVQAGDCISSISYERGFFWETIWNYSGNSDLKQKRKDPNVLLEGDLVQIPDKTLGSEDCASESKYKFKLKGVPARLKIKLMRQKPDDTNQSSGDGSAQANSDPDYKPPANQEEAAANEDYIFEVDGVVLDQGKTDGDGCVKISILPNAQRGRITLNKSKTDERIIDLGLGQLDPVHEPCGLRARLVNLGYFCQPQGPTDGDDLQVALSKFQQDNSLDATGKADDQTCDKLNQIHGC